MTQTTRAILPTAMLQTPPRKALARGSPAPLLLIRPLLHIYTWSVGLQATENTSGKREQKKNSIKKILSSSQKL